MNDYIAESVKKYPNRLVGFGRVDPRRDDAVRELTRMRAKLQLTGLKLHPIVECFRPDHPFFDKLFKKAADLRLPVLLHTGDGLSSPGLISAVVKKYPKLLVILGHLKEGALGPMKQFENVYVETSGSIPEVIELASHIDEERVLFGSDAPYYRYPTQIAAVEVADVSQKTKNKIFYGNFEELFPLN
jgi:predicted TIM-barrel fold metal-dependent hydrolase